ncbi:hypothetical protein SPRG_03995 [Saprolegnia parasitica CBS 223.65]|uniref:Helicase-associated domain-containing protein n=1 Tax=Saprolegnia parasitica (strain CBS 223.65) TaxID=695850 RepID=A0A067CLI8_SAPPC|nr:hypothetical protein SPRG_03995 [Saprolegnia parasitica CBS 223.65]KDO31378.1 hypothetical protein SPRG_03995 [Saprolegnia parasitica CBS 223.65]|eukprot:XP_012197975.1 hypothetical protein SPRG_03995 [Saprolegnia parasitica CBS 223.65]
MAGPDDAQATASNDAEAPAPWAVIVEALQTFRDLHDHVNVPADFDVPMTEAWPAATHGLQLGRRVALLRTQSAIDPAHKATLDELGFKWTTPRVQQGQEASWAHRLEALCLYREEHGDLAVPTTYVVPDSYPRHLQRFPLGRAVNTLRCQSYVYTPKVVQQRSDLDALGFLWRLRCDTTFCVVHRPGKRAPMSQLVAWSEQIEALVVFQRLNGHTNVPDGFVVPPDADVWPLPMHYVALDLALASLRAHVYELPEADAQRLREAGYFADLPDFSTFLKLLDIYRTEFGTCAVRIDFVVPRMGGHWINAWRGLALGDLAWSVGLKARALKAAQRDDLKRTGFVFNVDETWANVLRGLEHYGDKAVSPSFVAPPSWPGDLAGLRLGHYVERMHTAKRLRLLPPATAATFASLTQTLPAPQLLWGPPHDETTRLQVLKQLRDILRVIRDVYAVVPYDFVVPASGSAWPLGSHGVPLGVRLHWFWQQDELALPVCDEIRELGVTVSEAPRRVAAKASAPTARAWTLQDKVRALAFYRYLHGTANMPLRFTVPTASPWPTPLRGLKLAAFLQSLHYQDRALDKKFEAQLRQLGFSSSEATSRCVKRTSRGGLVVATVPIATQVAALHAYQQLVGTLGAMPEDFAVPPDDANWPAGSSDIVLSRVIPSLRSHWFELRPNEDACVRALGLFTDVPPFEAFVQLISRLTSDGKTTVPLDFVVPSEWSTQWSGAPLGELAWSLGALIKHLDYAKTQQLAAIGFEFNTPATWAHILDGLRTYHSLYGLTDVPEAFLVPRIATWPEDMHGMRLGYWVQYLHTARDLYLLPPDTIAGVDAVATGAEAPLPDTVSSGENSARPAIVPAATTADDVASTVTSAPSPDTVQPSPVAVRPSGGAQPAASASLAPDTSANEQSDHLVALDLWLRATPRPSESARLGTISRACPVVLRSVSVGAFLLELEVGRAFEHLQSTLDARRFDRQARWALKFQALTMFKALNGHLRVPRAFTVNSDAVWPAPLHGLQLGDIAFWLRRLTAADVVSTVATQLGAIGFEWDALPAGGALHSKHRASSTAASNAKASARGAKAKGGAKDLDSSRVVHSDPIRASNGYNPNLATARVINLCSPNDEDVDLAMDRDSGDRGAVIGAGPVQPIPVGVRRRQNEAEPVASVRRRLAHGWVAPPRGPIPQIPMSPRGYFAPMSAPLRGPYPPMPIPIDVFPWRVCLEELHRYFGENEHSNVPLEYVSGSVPLGRLVHDLRQGRAILTPPHLQELQALKFDWSIPE